MAVWKELLLGVFLMGTGGWLLWKQQPVGVVAKKKGDPNARLKIASKPAAKIYVLGEQIDPKTRSHTVQEIVITRGGTLKIRVERELFVPQTLTWSGLKSKQISVRLKPDTRKAAALLRLDTKPSGAVVYLDGSFYDATPTLLPAAKAARLRIRLIKPGYRTHSFVWSSDKGQKQMIRLRKKGPDAASLPKEWVWPAPRGKSLLNRAKQTLAKKIEVNGRDDQGYRMLHYAAQASDIKMLKFLLDKGARPNAANDQGQTPLHLSVLNPLSLRSWKQIQQIELLLKKGAALEGKDRRGLTPLHGLVLSFAGTKKRPSWRKTKLLNWLLSSKKAKANTTDAKGRSPLHHAARGGALWLAKLLLRYDKAGINRKDKSGKTPLDYAVEHGHFTMAAYLKGRGAKRSQ